MPTPSRSKSPVATCIGGGAFLAVCLLAAMVGRSQPVGSIPWYGILPPLVAVTLALLTNRIYLSLGVAVVVGGLLSAAAEPSLSIASLPLAAGGTFVFDSIRDIDNLQILLYVVLIMAMISVMLTSGGLQGVAAWLMRFARSARSTELVTVAAGLVIFIDDYANTMIVGPTMRRATDRQGISREKLAFLVDATAAPIAGIAVISTWIGVEVGLLSEIAAEYVACGVPQDGYAMFFDALGFRFYCIVMIAFVIFNALSGADFGPMARAQRRARQRARTGGRSCDEERGDEERGDEERGEKREERRERREGKTECPSLVAPPSSSLVPLPSSLVPPGKTGAEPHPQARIRASVATVPMAALLAVFVGLLWISGGGEFKLAADRLAIVKFSVWREVLSSADSIALLAVSSAVGLLLAMILAQIVARLHPLWLARAIWMGAKSSLPPATILVLAWSLKEACFRLQTGKFLATVFADSISPLWFPAIVFVVAAVTSFATGTSWGTMAILIPTAIPVALQLDGGAYGLVTMISIAAVLDGAIFGDHCSPISDTTIMSSAASSCDHMAHVRTQIPYSLTVAGLALFAGYLPAAMGMPHWLGILAGSGLAGLLFLVIRYRELRLGRSRSRGKEERGGKREEGKREGGEVGK